MEALAYRKNAVMVRGALEPGRPLPAVKGALRRRDVPVNLTRIKEFKPHFKSDSGSS